MQNQSIVQLDGLNRVILLTGHYGSGKTNLAVNLALDLRKTGRQVVLCDLDIVNPYFRSADFESIMHDRGIETISPAYANTNLDIPVLGPGLSAVVRQTEKTVIVDVGGDDAGAVALGRYAAEIAARPYSMLYVYNHYRYLTREAEEAFEVLKEINASSRLKCTGIVNNSNLGNETDWSVMERSFSFCDQLGRISWLPVHFTAVDRRLLQEYDVLQENLPENSIPCVYPIDIYVKKPWE